MRIGFCNDNGNVNSERRNNGAVKKTKIQL